MATAADDRDTGTGRVVRKELKDHENRDPITDAPGSHPVGTGVGAAAAGAAGAAIGSIVPGVGTAVGGAVGAVVGAVAGGLAGKAVAEQVNPTDEHAYWRNEHDKRDYYNSMYDYDTDYGPAYSAAIDTYNANPGEPFDRAEPQLRQSWESRRGTSRLDWEGARGPMRDVYERDRTRDRSRAVLDSPPTLTNDVDRTMD